MNSWSKAKYAVSGFVVGALFFGSIGFAASSSQSIQVSLQKVFFKINGVDKTTSDGMYDNNGTKVPASFMYKGTNYLPMRMVAEMLGKEVKWDGKNSTVLVGSEKGEGVYLANLNPLKIENLSPSNYFQVNQEMAMNGQSYTSGIQLRDRSNVQVHYALDSNYKTFTGLIGLDDNAINKDTFTVTISGDGREIKRYTLVEGSSPQELIVDVTGVMNLTIKYETDGYNTVDIANAYLIR
ncbi:NPCBM/NEW2 domain-containing protein [Cohnella sp. GbtcB17]|uniref:NPCBM/NEW2 domain-containing protein n=1 Tax=Cohnella sp. GbtcB17 TaxID=2824762 RepID=UPI001C2F8C0C